MAHPHGAVIRRVRQERGLSKSDLGERVRASYGHIDNVEYSRRVASTELLYRIARELAVPFNDLLCHDETCADLAEHRKRHAPDRVRRSA